VRELTPSERLALSSKRITVLEFPCCAKAGGESGLLLWGAGKYNPPRFGDARILIFLSTVPRSPQ
jgi:hypothetical protein